MSRPASTSPSPRSPSSCVEAVGNPDASVEHVDERPGQVDRHIGSTEKLAAADRLARANVLRRRARAHGRVVPRERDVVAEPARAATPASPRPRRRPGAARPARGRARPRHRRRSQPTATRPRRASRWPTSGRSSRRRTSRRSSGSRGRGRSTGSSRPAPTGRSASLPASRSGSACRIRSTPRRRRSSTSKARQRERFAAAGVPHARARRSARRRPFPCVVKALDRQGQRGLTLVAHAGRASPAVARGGEESRSGGWLVEELVEGPEVTVNAVSADGEFVAAHGHRPAHRRAARVRRRACACLAVRARHESAAVERRPRGRARRSA